MILAASKKPEYAKLIDNAVAYAKSKDSPIDDQVDATLDALLVQFGKEILNIVPGKVSTEVDARFSFDTEASVKKALRIIEVSSTSNDICESELTLLSALQGGRHWQGAHPYQDCLDLRGYQGRSHLAVQVRY